MMRSESDLVIGGGVIGSRVAEMLAGQGHRVSVVSRRGSGPAGSHPGGRGRGGRWGHDPPGRGSRGHLQLRQPALSPLADRLAADCRQPARRGGTQRRGVGHAVQPVRIPPRDAVPGPRRLRRGASDDRGHAAGRDGPKGTGPRPRLAGRARRAPGRPVPGGRGPRLRFRRPRRAERAGRAGRRAGPPGQERLGARPRRPVAHLVVHRRRGPDAGGGGHRPQGLGGAWHVPSNEPLSQRQVIDDLALAPTSVGYVSAPSPRPSFTGWDSSRRSCGSCARPSTSSAPTSSWIPRPPRRPLA